MLISKKIYLEMIWGEDKHAAKEMVLGVGDLGGCEEKRLENVPEPGEAASLGPPPASRTLR